MKRKEAFDIIVGLICNLSDSAQPFNLQLCEAQGEAMIIDFMDDLDKVELGIFIEKKLKVQLDDAEVQSWNTISDIIDTYLKNIQ